MWKITFWRKKGVNFVEKKKVCIFALRNAGLMAEWLGTALQKLLQRFESASDLQALPDGWRFFVFRALGVVGGAESETPMSRERQPSWASSRSCLPRATASCCATPGLCALLTFGNRVAGIERVDCSRDSAAPKRYPREFGQGPHFESARTYRFTYTFFNFRERGVCVFVLFRTFVRNDSFTKT